MAENNEFIREVNEDYRRDKVAEIWRRYSGVIIAVAILVVAGVGGWRYWQTGQRNAAEAASQQFDEANRLARDGKVAEADKAFDALEAQGPAGYRLLAQFRSAAETAKRDPAAGAAAFEAISGDTALGDG
ncbi:tetratricopeptide repeat protein, partial [Methylobacterium sp. WL116]